MVSTRSVRKVLPVAIASSLNVISTTEFSAIRVGNAAANAGLTVADTKPTKTHHLYENMQKTVRDITGRLLAIIGISGSFAFRC